MPGSASSRSAWASFRWSILRTFPATRPDSDRRWWFTTPPKTKRLIYRLVTSEEADVTKGLISTTSPIGRGIVGKKVGDMATIVTPNGKRELEILKLTTIHDEAGDGRGKPRPARQ